MLQRTPWAWQARGSISCVGTRSKWSIPQRRCHANIANDRDLEGGERSNDHEYLEAAENDDDDLSRRRAGPARRNITSMGTVSVQHPNPSKIEDLVSSVQPQNIGRASLPNTLPSILVLLITPAFAQHALSAELPLQLLKRFGENATASKPLEAITAVVDKLPAPGASCKGEEGLAYHFMTSPGPLPTFSQVALQSSTQKPGSLTFHLPKEPSWIDLDPAVQLPVAQTVFSTGLPSTMIHTRYEFEPLSGLLRKSASKRLEAQDVRVPIGTDDTRLRMEIPLLPLTPLRRVASSMGNIVRKVSEQVYRDEHPGKGKAWPPEDQSASQPASQELEAAVTEYFKLNDVPPAPVQVWALIVPRRTFEDFTFTVSNPKTAWKNRSTFLHYDSRKLQDTWVPRESIGHERRVVSGKTINRELSKLIRKGARLCQVLSGGGGWGKKAGLISLDPDTTYSTRDLRGESGWAFDFDGDDTADSFNRQQQQALGDIVREGDGIMLFLAPKKDDQGLFAQHEFLKGGDRSIIFGVAPSTIDENHVYSTYGAGSEEDRRVRHYPNSFGMLSEGGMALTLSRNGQTVTQTRLNVPQQQLILASVHERFREDGARADNQDLETQGSHTQMKDEPIHRDTSTTGEGAQTKNAFTEENIFKKIVHGNGRRGRSSIRDHNGQSQTGNPVEMHDRQRTAATEQSAVANDKGP